METSHKLQSFMQTEFEKWMEAEYLISAETLYMYRHTDSAGQTGYQNPSDPSNSGILMATSMWVAFKHARVVPEGYKLVPDTSTLEMDAAGSSYATDESYHQSEGVWAAMVNEAQPPKSWIGEGNAN